MGRAASRASEERSTLLRALAAGLLALVILAQGVFDAARSSQVVSFATATGGVASAARPCADGSDQGGSHQTPCTDDAACCILCSADVCAGSAAEAPSRADSPRLPRRVSVAAGRLPAEVDRRVAGWVSSWSAQAPPARS